MYGGTGKRQRPDDSIKEALPSQNPVKNLDTRLYWAIVMVSADSAFSY